MISNEIDDYGFEEKLPGTNSLVSSRVPPLWDHTYRSAPGNCERWHLLGRNAHLNDGRPDKTS